MSKVVVDKLRGELLLHDHTPELDVRYLNVDQTSEQTLVNGVPLLEAGRNIVDAHHLADKEYVDTAVTSLGVRYYMTDDDDASGYKFCSLDIPDGGEESYIASDLIDDSYIMGWISATGEAPGKLIEGIYDFQVTAEKTGGTKDLRVYWKLVERKSDDSEVVIATSSFSNLITDKAVFHPTIVLSSDYALDTNSRVVGKLYASVTGGGSAPEITLYYAGNLDSHWEIPANNEIFSNIFVPYTGANNDIDLGSHDLTTTGSIVAGDMGIGVADPDTKLEVFHAGDQLKLSFDATDNTVFAVDTSGDLTITPSGTLVHVAGDITLAGTVDGVDIATDVTANTTHRGSDGSDHSFINQDVTVGSSPTFDGTNFTGVPVVDKIGITIDGGGGVITTGIKGDIEIPFNCTINQVTLLADQSGSIVIDIWKDTYANYPPTVADTITASAKPTINSATKSQDTTLSGWTTSVSAGDTIRYNVDSCTDITRCTLILKVTKT